MTQPARLIESIILISCLLMLLSTAADAQPRRQLVEVQVATDHADWQYKPGQAVKFNITVIKAGHALDGLKVRYEVMPEKLKAVKSGELEIKNGAATVDGGTMKEPGFLRCWAYVDLDGKEYRGMTTAAFEPEKIQPTTNLPDDFVSFWDEAKAEAAKVPLDTRMTLLPERCTETVNVYHVNLQNHREGTRLYGIACIPKKPGKYPALLQVPGAGARPYHGDISTAEKGVITFQIGIHGVPVTHEPGLYNDMMRASISSYWAYNLDDRDHYYYKRVYLGCVRAVDFIYSLPEFDGEKLAVAGGSQGGALSIVAAGLDSRVKWLAPTYPALCDLTGYLHGRAGGWPHMFAEHNRDWNVKEDKIKTSKYYDVVNFAKQVKVPGYYSWGFNDTVCPPTSMYAAYNVITADKELFIAHETGHWTFPEQRERTLNWLLDKLLGNGNAGTN